LRIFEEKKLIFLLKKTQPKETFLKTHPLQFLLPTNGHKLEPTDGVSCRPTVTEPGFFPGKERG